MPVKSRYDKNPSKHREYQRIWRSKHLNSCRFWGNGVNERIIKMKRLVALLLIFAINVCEAQELIYANWGVGYNDVKGSIDDKIKYAEVGEHIQYRILDTKLGVGGWSDVNSGYRDAVFANYLVGVETRMKQGLYFSYMLGPAVISETDPKLGSNIQCSHEFEIGYRDTRGEKVKIDIRHFSNAGVVRPNEGRNFIGLGLEFKI
jgi:hypothetical protein